jgi:hypothetical protein
MLSVSATGPAAGAAAAAAVAASPLLVSAAPLPLMPLSLPVSLPPPTPDDLMVMTGMAPMSPAPLDSTQPAGLCVLSAAEDDARRPANIYQIKLGFVATPAAVRVRVVRDFAAMLQRADVGSLSLALSVPQAPALFEQHRHERRPSPARGPALLVCQHPVIRLLAAARLLFREQHWSWTVNAAVAGTVVEMLMQQRLREGFSIIIASQSHSFVREMRVLVGRGVSLPCLAHYELSCRGGDITATLRVEPLRRA